MKIYRISTLKTTYYCTVLRTNKGRTNKGQIAFFKKIYSELIRDKYFGKNFLSSKML